MIMKVIDDIENIKNNAKKAVHPIVEDITKSPSKFLFPSSIIQRYKKLFKS